MRKPRLWILALTGVGLLIVTGVLLAWPVNYSLWGPGPPPPPLGSLSGTNFMSLAFNPIPPLLTADDLINDINSQGGSVISVARCDTMTNGLITYTGYHVWPSFSNIRRKGVESTLREASLAGRLISRWALATVLGRTGR